MRGRSLGLGVTFLVVVGLAGAACGGGLAAGTAAEASASCAASSTPASIRVIGGNPAQRRLARQIGRWFGPSAIATVEFADSATVPPAHKGVENLIVSTAAGALTCQSLDRGLAQWESELFVGTYVSLMGGHPGASVRWVVSGRIGENVRAFPASYTSAVRAPTAAETRQQSALLIAAASADQAQVVSLSMIDTPERAVAITLRVTDPASFLEHQAPAFLQLLDDPRITLVGHYVGLLNRSGQLVWDAFRLPDEGGDFVIRSLAGCNPISNEWGGPTRACPAP